MKESTTALVTGGGRGIGKETSNMLTKKGMNVVICSRTCMANYKFIELWKLIVNREFCQLLLLLTLPQFSDYGLQE